MRRVVVTGVGAVSPYGEGIRALMSGLESGRSAIRPMHGLKEITGLAPAIAGQVPEYAADSIPRKFRRTMSPMSLFATLAAQEALAQAGLDGETVSGGSLGLSVSSTVGSVQALEAFFAQFLENHSIEGIKSTEFFKIMNHSCAANLAQRFGITGRVMAPSAACSTGCQAICLGAEAVATGTQDFMLCGGADELHPLTVGTFDIIQAASTGYNDEPEATPRPFDARRDGIVCSEGAGVLLLESLDSALARGAAILAEISGFASTFDPTNLASPSVEGIVRCMESALDHAGIGPRDVDYVNAHATGTQLGDAAESQAILQVMGMKPYVSSLKGHIGHTMAASGALELTATIFMLNNEVVLPTRNLLEIAPECSGIRHVTRPEPASIHTALKNNFALGGINTSMVLRRYDD